MKVVGVLFFSLVQAAISTVLSVGLALPVAHFFYRYRFPGKALCLTFAALLCIMPTKLIVLSIAQWYALVGFPGIILAHVMLNLPFSLFVLNLAYQKLDTTMLWVACDLGATSWQCYKQVVLPFLKSTIISMAIILFLLHVTSYSIPVLLGTTWYHSTPDVLMSDFYNAGHVDQAFWLGFLRLFVCVPLILLLGVSAHTSPPVDHRVRPGLCERYRLREHGIWWLVYGLLIACLTIVPIATLMITSCTTPVFKFLHGVACGAVDATLAIPVYVVVLNSLVLALVSGLCTVVVACALNFVARTARGTVSRRMLLVITVLPFLLGSVGVGILFAWFSYGKAVSAFVIGLLCHVFLNYPFAYRVISAQFEQYHEDMMRSAQTMGATKLFALRTVVFPFARRAFITAFCVAFGLSLTEVGAGSVLQGQIGMTMPMAIRIYRSAGMQDAVLGLSMILIALVVGVSFFLSRRGGT